MSRQSRVCAPRRVTQSSPIPATAHTARPSRSESAHIARTVLPVTPYGTIAGPADGGGISKPTQVLLQWLCLHLARGKCGEVSENPLPPQLWRLVAVREVVKDLEVLAAHLIRRPQRLAQ